MKKNKLILLVLGLIVTMNVSAQKEFKIGINAGVNYPDVRGNAFAKYSNFKVGYLIGFTFDYYLKENLSLKTNINYERKLKELQLIYYNNNAEEIGDENFTETYEYINIPILLKYEFGNSKFFINGGAFFNYLLNSKIEPEYPIDSSQGLTKKKQIDLGLSVGIGTIIALSEKNEITIELRDDFGIIDTGGAPTYVEGSVKTNTIKLILGWNLGI